jgi:CBS domain-containing protein
VARDLLTLLAEGAEVGALINAWDISRRDPPVLTPDSNLDQAAQIMEHEGLDELPVVEKTPAGKFLGLVDRHDIARALGRVALSMSAVTTRASNIFWASGYRVERMNVPRGLVGKTLREIDVRSRFGVSVLAVQRGGDADGGFSPSSPDRPFQADDVILVAGHAADSRRFASVLGDSPAASDSLR